MSCAIYKADFEEAIFFSISVEGLRTPTSKSVMYFFQERRRHRCDQFLGIRLQQTPATSEPFAQPFWQKSGKQ